MRKFSRLQWMAWASVALALGFAGGCSHSPVSSSEDGGSANEQRKLPFHEGDSGQAADSNAAGHRQVTPAGPNNVLDLPFAVAAGGSLPVGTLLTVRLEHALSSARAGSGAAFTAALQEPVVVNGNTVVARGTIVRGRIESARASAIKRDRGYVRLALFSIQIDGKEVALQTSSLFARGTAGILGVPVDTAFSAADKGDGVVQIQKGRLLTFRLASAVFFNPIDTAHVSKNSPPSSD